MTPHAFRALLCACLLSTGALRAATNRKLTDLSANGARRFYRIRIVPAP